MTKQTIMPKRREPNGRLKRVSDLQNEANAAQVREAQSVVLAQPHRRGNADVMCESPLGRFVLKHALERELYDAGILYASARRMWLGGCWKAPIDEMHDGSGFGIAEETARRLRDDTKEWFIAMKQAGGMDGAMAVQTMADGYECRETAYMLGVIASLKALAKAMGKI